MSLDYRHICANTATHKLVSGDSEIDSWFRKRALRDHTNRKHIVTCARLNGVEDVLGFYALSSVVESAKQLPDVSFYPFETDAYFPCLQLVYLAVHGPLQRQEHGTAIMGEIITRFADVGEITGLPAMIVTPLNPDARRFYVRLGFEPYPKGPRLVLPLQTAIATVEEARAEIAEEDTGR